ncbi:hypothetical protein F4777DRAFT_143357 [Nemania sp. FL0916]|nr:hypothetical protein F4777DRAFT_143357 [Nemania sp. FL0916]
MAKPKRPGPKVQFRALSPDSSRTLQQHHQQTNTAISDKTDDEDSSSKHDGEGSRASRPRIRSSSDPPPNNLALSRRAHKRRSGSPSSLDMICFWEKRVSSVHWAICYRMDLENRSLGGRALFLLFFTMRWYVWIDEFGPAFFPHISFLVGLLDSNAWDCGFLCRLLLITLKHLDNTGMTSRPDDIRNGMML